MARASTKHTHEYRVISYSLTPREPKVILECGVAKCIDLKVVCPLCEDDGNRRRHKSKHNPVKDRETFNRSLLLLTKAAIEYERLWGKPQRNDHGGATDTRLVGGAVVGSDDDRLPQAPADREARDPGAVGEPGRKRHRVRRAKG